MTAQDGPKTAPRRGPDAGSSRTSRAFGSKRLPGGPKRPPGGAQDTPRDPQEAARKPPRDSQDAPNQLRTGTHTGHKRLRICFQEAPERLTTRNPMRLRDSLCCPIEWALSNNFWHNWPLHL
eukprot:3469652-Pyramimonas_sp.AAC.1